jgi:hypothetical protein
MQQGSEKYMHSRRETLQEKLWESGRRWDDKIKINLKINKV